MSKKEKNVEKVAKIFRKEVSRFDDGSATWIEFENKEYIISIDFDGKGDKFEEITIGKKIYDVVDEITLARL